MRFETANFTGQIVNTSSRNDIQLEIEELGYQYDVLLGDGTTEQFFTVVISEGPIASTTSNVAAYARGFDDVCGDDTMDLVIRENDEVTTGVGEGPLPAAPASFQLLPPRPNPFNPRTTIWFDLPRAAPVEVAVFDVRGRRVKTLLTSPSLGVGRHQVQWDGTDETGMRVASGVYLVRMESQGYTDTKRMTLLK